MPMTIQVHRSACLGSSVLPIVRAAMRHKVTVIWDLMHFGWPDFADVFAPSFPARLGRYAGAFARWLRNETDAPPWIAPVNEMSFLAWAAGDAQLFFPFEKGRGPELKAQLVLATIEAIEAVRDALPDTRFLQPEPLINVLRADVLAEESREANVQKGRSGLLGRAGQDACGLGLGVAVGCAVATLDRIREDDRLRWRRTREHGVGEPPGRFEVAGHDLVHDRFCVQLMVNAIQGLYDQGARAVRPREVTPLVGAGPGSAAAG